MAKRKNKKTTAPSPQPHAAAGAPVAIVGIGASAGGLDAFKKLLSAMPTDSGIAFVLIPHLDPTHESLMVDLLSRHTRMSIVEAEEGMAVAANHVYIIPPNKYMTIAGGVLRLTGPVERGGTQTSIDLFLRSLADDQQDRAVCIILSGTGSHGTPGLKAVKAAGGMAMVQEPTTAEHPRMPSSAIATGLADYVLPPERMPESLVHYVQHVPTAAAAKRAVAIEDTDELNQVLAMIRQGNKFDFRCYRKKMLARRIERRMGLRHCGTVTEYLAYLREHPEEIKQLSHDLLIHVSSFFRDPQSLQAVAKEVIAPLLAGKPADASVRVWVPGCASGEEAYSLAMILIEEMTRTKKSFRLQVFATDVDEAALAIARQGIYADTISENVEPQRLTRFFTKLDHSGYQINKQVRESVMFAAQNLIGDAPFSKMDLISCRNVLIYLQPEVQSKVINLLHFALNEGGFLFLGPSETIGKQIDLFEPISKKWRIFRRIGPPRPDRVEFPIIARPSGVARPGEPAAVAAPRIVGFAEMTQRVVLEELDPAAVLINRKNEILYFLGSTTRFLEVPTGEPTQDLMMMVRDGLRARLRGAIHEATKNRHAVKLTDIQIRCDGGYARADVTVRPVMSAGSAGQAAGADGLLVIVFCESPSAPGAAPAAAVQPALDSAAVVEQLEFELRATKEDLQNTVEELQSSNEELKASNEEVMSMNEELQSANEELETSKEELQSLNEELTTVNNQLQDKVHELEDANDDMSNLFNCTDIPTMFLDANFRIRRFTSSAGQLLRVIGTDVGRLIGDITLKFSDPDLMRDADQVLRNLAPREKEVRADTGSWYLRRIVPYRTVDNRIEGVVFTFSDVTQIKKSAEQAHLLATVLVNSSDAIIVHDLLGNITVWNRGAERLYGFNEAQAHKMNILQIVPQGLHAEYRGKMDQLRRGEQVESYETQHLALDGRVVDVWVSSTAVTDDAGRPIAIANTERDVTDRKKARSHLEDEIKRHTAALRQSESRLRAILDAPGDAIITFDRNGMIDSVNPGAERMFGYSAQEMIGHNVMMLMISDDRDGRDGNFKDYLEKNDPRGAGMSHEARARRKDGTMFHVDLAISEVEQLNLHNAIIRDVTHRKELEREVVEIAALEQQRIGQDLHDQCGQELTALGLFAETLANALRERAPAEANMAGKIVHRAKAVLRQVRSIAKGLALAEVEAAKLPDALAELTSRLGETSGIRCQYHGDSAVHVADTIQATHLYHIAQEACTNALRHAEAKKIQVGLHALDGTLTLRVADDGRGLPDDVSAGLGLRIMHNRARLIGAKLSVTAAEPQGTVVTCTLTHERHHGRKHR